MSFTSNEIAELVKEVQGSLNKANSISTSTGINFLPLEEEARNTYPVFHKLLDMIPRVTPLELGHEVGGLQATWDQIVSPGTNVLPSIPEGSRSQYINIPAIRTSANFVTFGTDASVTFEAQSAGVGHNDNLGTARLASLNTLLNLEEREAIYGNSGYGSSGQNGFKLGIPNQPVLSLAAGGSLGSGVHITVYVVALTGFGVFNASTFGAALDAPGVAQTVSYTGADGSSITNYGGTSKLSPVSNTVLTTTDDQSVTVTITPTPGAAGYAVYVDNTDTGASPPASDAYFIGVFTTSVFTISELPAGFTSNQAASAIVATDYSFNAATAYTTGDIDGVITWMVGSQSTARPAYILDLAGADLLSDGAGGVQQLETAIATQWKNFQTTPDAVLVSSDVMPAFQQAMQTSPSGSGASTFWVRQGATDGSGVGGSFIEEYKCKFSAFGTSKVLPIINIPWLPFNTIVAPTFTNPYPAAGASIPANFRMVCREGYYAIKYPYVTRLHSQGVYVEEALECYVPWAGILLTSVGNTFSA